MPPPALGAKFKFKFKFKFKLEQMVQIIEKYKIGQIVQIMGKLVERLTKGAMFKIKFKIKFEQIVRILGAKERALKPPEERGQRPSLLRASGRPRLPPAGGSSKGPGEGSYGQP